MLQTSLVQMQKQKFILPHIYTFHIDIIHSVSFFLFTVESMDTTPAAFSSYLILDHTKMMSNWKDAKICVL